MGRERPSPPASPGAHPRLAGRARPGRLGGASGRRPDPRHRARLPGPRAALGLGGQLGRPRLQPLAPGSLRRHGGALALRAGRRSRARGPGGGPGAGARGRRLAGGRPAPGRRLALVPGDDARPGGGVGAVRPGHPRAGCRQAAELGRPHRARARAGPGRGRAAAGRGAAAAGRGPRPGRGAGRDGAGPPGPGLRAGPRPLPGHAAVSRASRVRGAGLPDAAGPAGGGGPALGSGQRRRPGLHERAGDGHHPQRRPHRRPRPHDDRPRGPLERRLGPLPPGRLRAVARGRHRDPRAVAPRRALRRARRTAACPSWARGSR